MDKVTIEITEKAADCLAWFAGHPFYGDTFSDIIVDLTEEWAARENKTLAGMYVHGEYQEYVDRK